MQASADRMWNYSGAQNLCPYQTGGGANWPTTFPGQDGRGYQNVSRVSQTNFSTGPQGANNGHHFVSSRVCHYNTGQESSTWSTEPTSCAQRDMPAYQNLLPTSWGPSGVGHGHGVVPEHHVHSSGVYQKVPPPYPHNCVPTRGQFFSGGNTNRTPRQQPDAGVTLLNALELRGSKIVQKVPEMKWQIIRHRTQKSIAMKARAQARMPERIPESLPVRTPVRMPTRVHVRQYCQSSSLHGVRAPKPPEPEAVRVPGELSQLSKPDNRSRCQNQTPMLDVAQMQNPEALELPTVNPSSPSCSALRTVAVMQPVSGECLELAGLLSASARGASAQKDPSAGDTGGQTASPVRKHQDHNAPPPLQPEEHKIQSQRPASVRLQSLLTRMWTQADLAVLVRDYHQAQMNSPESSVLFNSEYIINMFWKDPKILLNKLCTGWYKDVMNEAYMFCDEHLAPDTLVLTEAKCDLNICSLQVLQDGEVYSEMPYSSFWRNINRQLDDIDKEFGFERNFLHHARLPEALTPSGPAGAEAPLPEAKSTSLEDKQQEKKQGVQELEQAHDEPEIDSATSASPGDDPDDVYSFVIHVLPQEEAKAIYESIHHAEEAPLKGDPKGSVEPEMSVDKGDSERGEEDQVEAELESLFEHWDEILFAKKREALQNDLEDVAAEMRCEDRDVSLRRHAGNRSMDSHQSRDASPLMEQKEDDEREIFAQQKQEQVVDRESEEVYQQNEHEMANACQQDDQESGKVTQQVDDHAMANISQLDDRETRKVAQNKNQEMANVCQQEDNGALSQQDDDQVMGRFTQKDAQDMANVSQQDDDQEMANVSQPVLVLPSQVSCPTEMWTFGNRHRVEVIATEPFPGERPLCLAAKRLAAAKKKRKRAKHSGISIPCRKKLKTKHLRKNLSKRNKEASPAKRKLPVELVLFGSAGRKRHHALTRRAPDVLTVSSKGRSPIKQKIYEQWRLPPTRIDGKSKLQFPRHSVDEPGEESPLPTITFRKNNGKISLSRNKRSVLDGPDRDASALDPAADRMLTTTGYHRDKLKQGTERLPWDHQLRHGYHGNLWWNNSGRRGTGSS
ncbi:uncharacterized protein LOC133411486 isoform X2 [Phycodurus eques]|nr:uncharacterized protein LOC133411486 isoform X2 [Phycodurus eques]XP_061549919.1 uncharacterized protein LOC133411486 isoform X2 [Phycodurus eques]XP_061549920.1 uncharacterized protein LOC133411486 isoform X2 [Phycodurus eques]XP_061549921.1 uncharacterized protein LOC133411486 isoform X2 [Phycodurus eques]XP_061549922.1 uncharacterized protein LOC133411486 isoform X2 [Phycodurus eques]XP_061549923.1 uncharacterized protein LOC133411486 isoform X2 [Phycodurus eques]